MLSFQSVHSEEPLWLNWSGFDNCEVRHIGWDGPENEEESDANSKQVDDGNQEDTAKID